MSPESPEDRNPAEAGAQAGAGAGTYGPAGADGVTVRDNPQGSRYEVFSGEDLAGFSQYRLTPGRITFTHTETAPAFAGQGLAKRLVAEALDDVRRRGLAVLPLCPYVKKYIAQHPAYIDLVPSDERQRFGLQG
ncbi:GNAT family N-acetyltransferase [Streptomyces sp. ODS28]|uniref:GNAT family N-acetyltransferase n=1 Tax=Streptomyces sp. ODS28 TaxID=3136688 RepID=UPI0031F16A8F